MGGLDGAYERRIIESSADHVRGHIVDNHIQQHIARTREIFRNRDIHLIQTRIGSHQSSVKNRDTLASDEAFDGSRSADSRAIEFDIQRHER
jgi:hypothetical protein